uniref:Uncharacterized protein n=1 Tax=Oryza punctata TaxID=4537 RepID=A0A0E0JM80_ORYPU
MMLLLMIRTTHSLAHPLPSMPPPSMSPSKPSGRDASCPLPLPLPRQGGDNGGPEKLGGIRSTGMTMRPEAALSSGRMGAASRPPVTDARLNGNADHALAALERAPERRRFGIIVVRPSQTKPGQAIAPSSSLRCPLYLFSITPKNGPPESEIAVFFLNSGQLPPSSIPLSPLGGRMKPSPSPCQFYRRREAISFGAAVQISSGCNQTSVL